MSKHKRKNITRLFIGSALLLGVIFLITSFRFIQKTDNAYSHCQINNVAFKDGEALKYKVFYNWNFVWMSAGYGRTLVEEKNDNVKVKVNGNTYSSYDWFFKIRDYYETNMNKSTLLPTVSLRSVKEGGYSIYDKVTFNQDKKIATSLRGKTKSVAKPTDYQLDDCVHDIVSMMYFYRNVDYKAHKEGTSFPMKIFMDKKAWNIDLTYEGRENVKLKGVGKFKGLKLKTKVSAGELFDENSYVTIWVTDDKNKLPLLVELELSIGSIKVLLEEYNGLRYPLEAKTE